MVIWDFGKRPLETRAVAPEIALGRGCLAAPSAAMATVACQTDAVQECMGPAKNNPCHECRKHGPMVGRCYYRPHPMGLECVVCHTTTYGVTKRCCVPVCLPCTVNELRGICPLCDRDELNRLRHCHCCHTDVGRFGYDCESCDGLVCLDC